jgi:SOS response associated peptidase (SRAP)
MEIDSILGEGSKDRLPDHQWRAETVDKAPSYRQAFKKRRCLIPADRFYEWRKTAKPKLPFAIAMKDDARSPLPAFGKTGNLKELLLPYPADQMRIWEISPRIQPEE